MRANNIYERVTSNGIKMIIEENYRNTNPSIRIGYNIPLGIDPKFDGVAHMAEHLIFNDIKEGYSGQDIMTLADQSGCTINAYTAMEQMVFMIDVSTFDVPRSLSKTNAFSRFSITHQGLEFMEEYIKGIVKPHSTTREELEKEKGIVKAELYRSIENRPTRVSQALHDLFHKYTVIGKDADVISNITRRTVNEFMDSLGKPIVTISYNPELESTQDVVRIVEYALQSFEDNADVLETTKHRSPKKIDYVDTIFNFVEHPEGGCAYTKLNTIGILQPRSLRFRPQDVQSNVLQSIALEIILDLNRHGSLGSYLREERNLIYGFDAYGIINRKGSNIIQTVGAILNDDAINISKSSDKKQFIKDIDKFLSEMEVPSCEDYLCVLREHATAAKNQLVGGLGGHPRFLSIAIQGGGADYFDAYAGFEQDYSYEDFVTVFQNTLNDLTIILL